MSSVIEPKRTGSSPVPKPFEIFYRKFTREKECQTTKFKNVRFELITPMSRTICKTPVLECLKYLLESELRFCKTKFEQIEPGKS